MHLDISLPSSAEYLRQLIIVHFKRRLKHNNRKYGYRGDQNMGEIKMYRETQSHSILSINLGQKEGILFLFYFF